MKKLNNFYGNKKIIIIGAASGIGEAITHELMKYDAKLFLTARSIQKLEKIFGESEKLSFFELDITQGDEVRKLFSRLNYDVNGIDMVINFAGYDVFKQFGNISGDDIEHCIKTNIQGLMNLTGNALEYLFNDRVGTLVTVCGFVNGKLSMPFFSIDAASRSAVVTFFKSLRREYSNTDLKFILFSPTGVNTRSEREERGFIWKANRFKLLEPENLAQKFLVKLAKGKENIIIAGFGEKVLAFFDNYYPALADVLFFDSFVKKTTPMLEK